MLRADLFNHKDHEEHEGNFIRSFLRMRSSVLLIIIISIGILLRVWGLFTEPWLDEVWALKVARESSTLSEFFAAALDGHLSLSVLMMYWLKPIDSVWPERLISFAAGVGILWLMSALASPKSRWVTMVLARLYADGVLSFAAILFC
jgi:hypothetical protein